MASSNDSNSPPNSKFGGVSTISAPISIPRPGSAPIGGNPSLMADAYERQGVPLNMAATAGASGFRPVDMASSISDATTQGSMSPLYAAQSLAQTGTIRQPQFNTPQMRRPSEMLAQAGVYGHPLFQQRAVDQIAAEPAQFGAKIAAVDDPARQRQLIGQEVISANYNEQFYSNYGVGNPNQHIAAPVAQAMYHDEYNDGIIQDMNQHFGSYSSVAGPNQGLFEGGSGLNRLEPTTGSLLDVTASQALRRANKEAHRKGTELDPSIGFDQARLAVASAARRTGVDPSILNNQIAVGSGSAKTPLTRAEMEAYGASLDYAAPVLSNSNAHNIDRLAGQQGVSIDADGNVSTNGFGGGASGGAKGGAAADQSLEKNTAALNKVADALTRFSGGGGGGGSLLLEGPGSTGGGGVGGGVGGGGGPGQPLGPIQPGFAPPGSTPFRKGMGLAGGLISGMFGGQATDTDTRGRRIAKGIGRAIPVLARGAGAAMRGRIGGDLASTLGSVPGFNRGFEGIGVFGGFAEMGASGELPALQASEAFGLSGSSGNFLTQQMGGAIGAGADFGISAEQMGSLMLPLAQSAGGGMNVGDVTSFTRAFAGGEDVGGVASLIGQQRQAGFRGNRAAEFNAAKGQGLRGSAATGFASNLFGAFRGVSAGSGIQMDRLKTEGRILGMGGGDIEEGSARFQRGMGVHKGAVNQLFSGFQGVSDTLLMADAMGRANGDFLQAQKLLERDQAQGGAMAQRRLMGMGMDRRTARTLLGGQLTSQDQQMMGRNEAVAGGEDFNFNEATGGNATFISGALANRRNEQLGTVYSERGRSTFKEIQRQEKRVENELVKGLYDNIDELGTLTGAVLTLNKTIDGLVKLAQIPVKAAAGSSTAVGPAVGLYNWTLSKLGIE